MHVVIAIVGFRNPGDIANCLACLSESVHADFEVVICENGGEEAFARLVEATSSVLPGGQAVTAFAAESNLGFAGGVNRCIESRPDADAWWVLNPDTCPAPGALSALAAKLSDGGCDAVGGVLRLPDGTNQAYGGSWTPLFARTFSIGMGTAWSDPIDAQAVERRQNYILGASMLVGRRFIATVGLMREDYFLYCEEIEWCVRAVRRGMRLGFAPDAAVTHEAGSTTGSAKWSRLSIYLGERNKMLLIRDSYPLLLPVAAVLAAAIFVIRAGKRGAWRAMVDGLQGVAAGICNRRGPPPWLAPDAAPRPG